MHIIDVRTNMKVTQNNTKIPLFQKEWYFAFRNMLVFNFVAIFYLFTGATPADTA